MQQRIACLGLAPFVLFVTSLLILAQTPRRPQRPRPAPTEESTPNPTPDESRQEIETLKIDTNLVTVPVIATDATGLYVPDLRQEEFSVLEDGIKQNIAFFNTVSAPFHVILMLDTSASTEQKLTQIKNAAIAFVEQLQPRDRVKVISFDDEVRDLNDFTNDRAAMKSAILQTRSGQGTKLYDAFELALNSIRAIRGRKAIVLFTDGVDYHSDQATFDGTLHNLDEEGVIVYPIRYETRAETEAIARGQADDPSNQLPTIGVIRSPAPGTTAPTFPSDDPGSVPTRGSRPSTGAVGSILDNILRGGRRNDPYPPDDRQPPDSRQPPDNRQPRNGPTPDPGKGPVGTSRSARRQDDSISVMLDGLYFKADSYLKDLADKSGGRLLRADTLGSLPDAFAKIAAELRTQYSIGYYPTNSAHDGQYRKVKVSTTRKSVSLRARPGYRAPSS
jgi:von Willebrand factor type A domain